VADGAGIIYSPGAGFGTPLWGVPTFGGAALADTGEAGYGEATIPPFTAEGAGAVLVDGFGEAALPAYAGEGAGAVLVEGVGESALPAIAASGAGTVYAPEVFGSGEATFAAFVADGVGDVLVIGSGEATVPALVAAGRGFQGELPEHRAGSEQTVLRRRGFSTTALRS